MTDEGGRRRRGRRRGRQENHEPGAAPPPVPQEKQPPDLEVAESSDVTGVTGSRFSFRRRRTGEEHEAGARERSREKTTPGSPAPSTSPMDFWRSGQARSYRDPRVARKSMTIWQRISGFHFPAWAPVVFIIAIVFGILGFLFYYRSAAGAPRIGDHWHAPYAIFIGDELQPRIQEVVTSEGVHTHGDSVIHLHPHLQVAEGSGAGLGHFFGDQGGKLTNSEMKIPGRDKTYKNGDTIEGEDRPSELRILKADSGFHPLGGDFNRAIVACNAKAESEFERVTPRYVPKDGDCIRIIFGPPDVPVVVEQDRTIIDPSTADRDIQMEVTGHAAETVFTPASIEVQAGETVKVVLRNNSEVFQEGGQTIAPFHGLRFSGADREYGTSDDFVLSNIDPSFEGSVAIKYGTPGEYEFRDEQALENVTPVTGKVIVGEAAATPAPGATPTPVPADLSLEVTATDTAFEPAALTVEAGKTFRLKLTNSGTVIHNLRIAGPDGEFDTEDDIVTATFVNPGGTGEIVGKIDAAGTYAIRDDYHKTTLTGTLTVQ